MSYLDNFKQAAIWAHNGTSFSPEKRGENLINEFEQILTDDLTKIEAATQEQKDKYIDKFKSLFSAWLGAKQRCISTMITGPANFPVRRAEKANRSEQNKYELFTYWRQKAIKAIIKSTLPESNPLEEAKQNLSERVKTQEAYKVINKAYKAFLKKPESLDTFDLPDWAKKLIKTFDPSTQWYKMPIAPFQLTNNLANIKRLELRVKELEQKEAVKNNEDKVYNFDGGKLILNYSIDRIQIQHDTKPEYSVISDLKKHGFHWSPSQKAWQRQLTNNALYTVKHYLNLNLSLL
jgi:hypothetical protein